MTPSAIPPSLQPPSHPDLSPRQIRSFLRVAHELSYTAAANALGYSEPAVYHQVRQLEADLGCRLITRSGSRLALTAEADKLVPYLASVLAELDRIHELAAGSDSSERIVVAFSLIGIAQALADAVADFCREQPSAKVDVLLRHLDEMIPLVANDDAVVGVFADLGQTEVVPRKLSVTPCTQASMRLYATSPQARLDPSRPTTVYTSRAVAPGASALVAALPPHVGLAALSVLPTVEAVKSRCFRDGGIACVPDFVVAAEQDLGMLHLIHSDVRLTFDICVLHANGPLPPLVRQFIDLLQRTLPRPLREDARHGPR